MNLKIKKIADFPTSTYNSTRYDPLTIYVAGSMWNRKEIIKDGSGIYSAQGVLHSIKDGRIESATTDSDMLYIVEKISADILFLGAKTEKNAFQLFSISENKVLQKRSDLIGGGCYGTMFTEESQELIMNTRKGYLQIVDPSSLTIKKSERITEPNIQLWQLYFDSAKNIIYTSDYLGNLYKISKETLKIISQESLMNHYCHLDNHSNYPSLWGLSGNDQFLFGGDRFGGITIFDKKSLQIVKSFRMRKDGDLVYDPKTKMPSQEVESIMSLKSIGNEHFIFGSRWGNVFLCDLDGNIEKILNVPMGIQKENSPFTMEYSSVENMTEILVTFGDGQVYSIINTN